MSDGQERCWAERIGNKMQCDLCNISWELGGSLPRSCIASIELRRAVRNGWIILGNVEEKREA